MSCYICKKEIGQFTHRISGKTVLVCKACHWALSLHESRDKILERGKKSLEKMHIEDSSDPVGAPGRKNMPLPPKCLEIMLNDIDAISLFETGPLSWFNLYGTVANISKRGTMSGKQESLIRKVFDEYMLCKKTFHRLKHEGYVDELIRVITKFMKQLPPSKDRSETGYRGYLGNIRSALSAGEVVHLKILETIEKASGEINPKIAVKLWKELQEIRLKYLEVYYAIKNQLFKHM